MSEVLLVVTGGIAAYKACEVLRGLQKAGCTVSVAMTEDATHFVGPATFEALSGRPPLTHLYGYPGSAIPHIEFSERADLALVVPASANTLAKMAHGIADDSVSTTLLACSAPVAVAPAMNVRMWQNPATQANLQTLKERGVIVIEPDRGRLACGDVGEGKLASVEAIVAEACELLQKPAAAQDLLGKTLVITAGPTHEAIDPVRFIANASSGKMGYAIAREAQRRGAEVRLVSGPVSLEAPQGVTRIDVVSAAQMHKAALEAFEGADAAICVAAVADYTPAQPAAHKLKKSEEHLDVIELVETADILASLSACKGERIVIGFAAETQNLISYAQAKLASKGCDLIVANDVSRPDSSFGADTSRISLVSSDGVEELETLPLAEVARAILDRLVSLL